MALRSILAGLALLVALLLPPGAHAAEEIRILDARIEVEAAGTLLVTETITVNAEGRQIRRGIFRDIPLLFEDDGRLRRAGLDIVSVTRDGRDEPYRTERMGPGIRIWIGEEAVSLQPGVHTYVIAYETTRQVLFFDDYDEVYWNATGNEWDFPILAATATVVLPEDGAVGEYAAYTGRYGTKAASATSEVSQDRRSVTFETTRRLEAGEGLTVSVNFPKGVVSPPGALTRLAYLFSDYRNELVATLVLLGVAAFFAWAWNRVGRDPPKGTVIPLFDAPDGVGPDLANYVHNQGFSSSGWPALAAACISLAVKGLVAFEDLDGTITLERVVGASPKEPLSPGEEAVLKALDGRADGRLTISRANGPAVQSLGTSFRSAVERQSGGQHFRHNTLWLVAGVALAALGYFVFTLVGDPESAGTIEIAMIAGLVILAAAGWYLLGAPTPAGRRLMDQIEGLKLYLSVAERERMNMAGAPAMTPTRFETLLPYAVALGVERPWSTAFEGWLSSAAAVDPASSSYHPRWYRGRRFDSRDFGSSMSGIVGGMSQAFRSSIPPPKSSSSGSRGGGFSGGGRGGGGGGGW